MMITAHPVRETDGTLVVRLDRPITVGGVNASGLRAVAFFADDTWIGQQRGGRTFPVMRGVSRLVLSEAEPFGLGPVTITTLDDRPARDAREPQPLPAPWLETEQ